MTTNVLYIIDNKVGTKPQYNPDCTSLVRASPGWAYISELAETTTSGFIAQ
jgi:hypothetical protein